MDTDFILKSHETRLQDLERDSKRHGELISSAEDKASSAWKMINEVKKEVGDLTDKVDELDNNVRTVMSTQADTNTRLAEVESMTRKINEDNVVAKSRQKIAILILKIILAVVAFLAVVNIIFFVYIWNHNQELARELLTFGASVVKAVP